MSLFQNSVLNKYLNELDIEQVEIAWKKFATHFQNPDIQENIRNSKEEQYQGEFLIDLFVNVFGYIKNPTPNFNLTTELKNVKGAKKADGAILQNDEAIAAIELKGTDTIDLAKVETQAFGYKNNHPKCLYVITSNFEKLRFYIENAVEFEEFNLFNLERKRFDLLWLCLSADNLLIDIPKKIKDESISEGEIITKKLYRDYSNFRNEVFSDIVRNNPHYDKLTLFRKTQKLLDRFLFILFAEDKSLLPPNSTEIIIKDWKDLRDRYDEYFPLYDRFKKYFGYLNEGYKGRKHDIFAYNGGLFLPDDILDNIKIDDELLSKHTKILSNYDFASEVSVNILGHIFEHSLTEIESIQAELKGEKIDKSKTKRKKDGVFYTPTYITKYIVDNTIGKLCSSQKAALEINDEDYEKRKGRRKTTVEALRKKLDYYREWLLNLTICDPACGSGAFLNQALEFLIAEHRYVDELYTNLEGFSLPLTDLENAILENNLFGVDINEESVEIAKLSLWLRTAQKGRKLTTLNNNIKCGNSLIDDAEIAGEKAFVWKDEFPKVFANGGFDVVIGNPPYVQLQKMKEISVQIKELGYKTFESTGDLYCLFYEKGHQILKKNGLLGYITSNKWMRANYGKSLRKFINEETNAFLLLDLGSGIFDGAVVDSNILIFEKSKLSKQTLQAITIEKGKSVNDFSQFENEFVEMIPEGTEIWTISSKSEYSIKQKIEAKGTPLKDWDIKINRGILTGFNEAFIIDKETKDELIRQDAKNAELFKPILRGKDINRYYVDFADLWLINTHNGYKELERVDVEKYPAIKNHLNTYWEKISKRYDKGNTPYNLRNCAYVDEFEKEKIIYQEMVQESSFSYHEKGTMFCVDTGRIITGKHLKYILCILNTKLFFWSVQNLYGGGGLGEKGVRMKHTFFEKFPLIQVDINTESFFIEKADQMLSMSKELNQKNIKFLSYIESQFPVEKFTQKLQNWHELEFADFINELGKAINKTGKEKLTKSDEMEWMELFETKKVLAQAIKSEIDATDRKIDEMVYELYGLEEDEIAIVENSLISD